MSRHVAFLRGMNLGKRRAKSPELRSCFEDADLEAVSTFRASGNVIFTSAGGSTSSLTVRIEAALERSLGYAVVVFLRTERELMAIADQRPFDERQLSASAGKLQVAMLAKAPSASARAQVLALADEQDRLAFGKRELYWLPSGGILDSRLDLKRIEKLLGAQTVRTKNTVEQIAAKYFSDA
jgi:uncharacterized protein (DUF1697 family)